MGLAKQYLRYVPGGVFGLVASPALRCIAVLDHDFRVAHWTTSDEKPRSSSDVSLVAVAACESVIIWDVRTGTKLRTLEGDKSPVTALAASSDRKHFAVGYEDGCVKMFDLSVDPDSDSLVTFQGHKKGIMSLNFDAAGSRLASASKDTTIIVWDVVAECGIVRLKGHRDAVTQVRFLNNYPYLISSSKDTMLKFWDLETHHCFKTVPGHRTEVWDFDLISEGRFLVTGSTDNEIRVWELAFNDQLEREDLEPEVLAKRRKIEAKEDDDEDEDKNLDFESEETEEDADWVSCLKVASVLREGKERVVSVRTDPKDRVLGVHGNDNMLELFQIRTEEELEKLRKKRQKKAMKKRKAEGEEGKSTVGAEERLLRLKSVKPNKAAGGGKRSKIKGFCVTSTPSGSATVSLLMHNNLLSFFTSTLLPAADAVFKRSLGVLGHRSDVRAVAFASDGFHLVSAAAESLKVWTVVRGRDSTYDAPEAQLHCISTLPCDYALAVTFLPGDRHALVATKSGTLQLFDVAAAALIQTFEAHAGECWSVHMSPDKRGLVSGGADKIVKFWDFELVSSAVIDTEGVSVSDCGTSPPPSGGKQLTLAHKRSLQLDESVLGVKFAPDGKLLAVALLDQTVKIFFVDSLKFFLSLYGHKLPVLAMDMTSDATLIATASADRNIKIWGLDFGDCHKSIFAHEDSILGLHFIPKTHLFFSCGKDGKIHQWDADNFERVITLDGHQDDVLCLAVTQNGGHVLSAGRDKSLRLWNKTKEIVVPTEEAEQERESGFEGGAGAGEAVVPGEDGASAETARPGRRTLDTVKMAERLLEALDIYVVEDEKFKEHGRRQKKQQTPLPAPQLHPMFLAYDATTPLCFMLEALRRIKTPELEEALLLLPFHRVSLLLNILLELLKASPHDTELCIKTLMFLLKVHHGQVATSRALMPVVQELRRVAQDRVGEKLDQVGFNMAGLSFVQRRLEDEGRAGGVAPMFADATQRFKQKAKKAKKSKAEGEEAIKTAAVLTIV